MHRRVAGSPGPPGGPRSYVKPRLERLGTFRELTQAGGTSFTDQFTTGIGCLLTGSTSYTCTKPPV